MAASDGVPIPAGEGSSEAWEGAGEVEDKGRKVLVEGIDERGPEEGGQRKGAMAERADELRSSLVDVRRRKEEMTTGSHKKEKYLGVTPRLYHILLWWVSRYLTMLGANSNIFFMCH